MFAWDKILAFTTRHSEVLRFYPLSSAGPIPFCFTEAISIGESNCFFGVQIFWKQVRVIAEAIGASTPAPSMLCTATGCIMQCQMESES